MKRIKWIIFLFTFLSGGNFIFAQAPDSLEYIRIPVPEDTIYSLPADTVSPMLDTVIIHPAETIPIVFQPDSLILDSLKYEFTKIKEMAYRNALTKGLYKLVFVNPSPDRVDVMRSQRSDERFIPYRGKNITKIDIKLLPPYGRSVYDTAYIADDLGFIKKVANGIHIKTRPMIIRQQLTIKENEPLRPFELVQTEILLRHLPYIDDALILVSEDPDDPEGVYVLIICKDDFSWGGEFSSNFSSRVRVSVTNKNLFSLGHYADYTMLYDNRKDKVWGNTFEYRITNFFGWHFDLTGYYRNNYEAKEWWVELNKQFLTSATKWAGGAGYARAYRNEFLPELDIKYVIKPFDYSIQDVWLGRSFLLSDETKYTPNIYLTTRFMNIVFNNRPEISLDSNQIYYNRRNAYTELTFRKLRYYKANLIYDFGKTEDIPVGLLTSLTVGMEDNDYKTSMYTAWQFLYSYFNLKIDRFYALRMAWGSYINKGGFERSLFKTEIRHITNLMQMGNARVRFYLDANYVNGYRRYRENYLYLNDENIIGFDSDTLRGHKKFSFSLASTFFLPYIVKGFRTSMTASLDMGFIASERRTLLKDTPYWGTSVAINLRNDNLVFKTISIRLSFYPRVPADMNHISVSMSGRYAREFYDYGVHKPQVVPFR